MQRLLDADPDELRGQYLFDFAFLYKMGPREVDALRFMDFVNLIINADAYKREMAKQNAAGEVPA